MSSGFGKIPVLGQLLRPKTQFVSESPPTATAAKKTYDPTLGSTPPIAEAELITPRGRTRASPSSMVALARQYSDQSTTNKSTEVGSFQPPINVEPSAFLMPEDQVSVELLQRLPENEIQDFVYKPSPLYISSCYDAYSRNYTAVSIGKGLSPSIQLAKFGTDDNTQAPNTGRKSSADMAESFSPLPDGISNEYSEDKLLADSDMNVRIMQPYCPSLSDWFSTFRSVPDENAHLLSGKVSSDANVLFKFSKVASRQKPFEPLYGSITLYTIVEDEIHRITESFHFDAASASMRQYYGTCYVDSEGTELHPAAVKNYTFTGNCINVADASGDRTHMHMCNVQIPEELRHRDLFMVVQLSKIMSCDNEKAAAPYYPRAAAPEISKHKESCERLSRYRQPLGLGIVRVNDEAGRLFGPSHNMGELTVPIFAQKVALSDLQIQQVNCILFCTHIF